ncbi:MAG TPA: hypothetical protein VE860_11945, partial [Chthoniobacterales bacterium]|nr:hypothetical protein [Chthoniobacterales bacterium]
MQTAFRGVVERLVSVSCGTPENGSKTVVFCCETRSYLNAARRIGIYKYGGCRGTIRFGDVLVVLRGSRQCGGQALD